jgi:hypothetical protein
MTGHAARIAELKLELDRWRGAAPTSVALDAIGDLITKTAEQANALALHEAIHDFDDIGAVAGVNIRLRALQDAKAAVITAGLREHEERKAASDEDRCPTCGRTGPDDFDPVGDYGGGPYEARCGDEWHDDKVAVDEDRP